jgi:hypothetical protein
MADFPKRMLYRALKLPNGKVTVLDPAYHAHTTKIVSSEGEFLLAKSLGWSETPWEAEALFEAQEVAISDAAAERAYDDLNMSEKAKKESDEYEASVPTHVPVIPEAVKPPKKPRKQKDQA